jgi:hypothetical protein
MRKLLHLSWALLGAVSLSGGCSSNHVLVEAKNPTMDTFQGSVGSLNTPAYTLGDVIAMDSQTHKVWKAASVQINALDLAISPQLRETAEPLKSDLSLWYSQKLPVGVKGDVSERVKSDTTLHVEDYFTRSLKYPAIFIVGSDQLATRLAELHRQSPNAKFFLVSAITSAKKVYLACDDADKQLSHMGKREFEVKYKQNESLEQLAQKEPAFFKLTALKLDDANHVTADKDAGGKLPEHQFDQVLAMSWQPED